MDESLTRLIQQAAVGDDEARQELYNRVHSDLRVVAHRVASKNRSAEFHTTALVNEVVFRFEKGDALAAMENRRVFFSVATRAMNQILIDHYRKCRKSIDSPDRQSQPLDAVLIEIEDQVGTDFSQLQLELSRLANESPRQHAVVMHRYFGGLTIPQTAEILGVSVQTVQRDWRLARATLFHRLRES